MTDRDLQPILPSFLMVTRFVVRKGDQFVYDQAFKMGLNIIRGDNTTGKSTVMDLMYFALGAELTEWTTEQSLCDETLIEVRVNYSPFCLRREITETGKSAMYFYEGVIDDAMVDAAKWYRYPTMRSGKVQSFSQKLFELLSLPSHKTDDSKNLTMHQLLRLMYVDQLSETTKLLKEDKKYDNASIRRAIGEYLLGIDNLEAHNIRQDLIEANSRFDRANAELKAIYKFIGSTNAILRESQIDDEIGVIESDIRGLEEKKVEVRTARLESLDEEVRGLIQAALARIKELTDEARDLRDSKDDLSTEIVDTSLFVNSLEQRLAALEQSKATNSELGELVFKYCPACLTPITTSRDAGHCGLCKEHLGDSRKHYAYIQMSNEIHFQKKESEQLLVAYKEKVSAINNRLPVIIKEIDYIKREHRDLASNLNSSESLLSEIGSEIGYKMGAIASLEDRREMIGEVEKLIDLKTSAQEGITRLEEKLSLLESTTKDRYDTVYSNIENIAKYLLHKDGGYEESFEQVEDISIDFARDRMAVNGRSKFSASSMVVMKNSIRIAIYLHCISDESSRLPRFMLLDNIEDKGMTESRSQNFQRQLVAMCDDLEKDYQLIFTTSMIDPELDKSDYVVGPHYRKGEHTLAFN
ncbi:MAG: hypothetical protein AB8B57_00005 [Congregibacter sp.]